MEGREVTSRKVLALALRITGVVVLARVVSELPWLGFTIATAQRDEWAHLPSLFGYLIVSGVGSCLLVAFADPLAGNRGVDGWASAKANWEQALLRVGLQVVGLAMAVSGLRLVPAIVRMLIQGYNPFDFWMEAAWMAMRLAVGLALLLGAARLVRRLCPIELQAGGPGSQPAGSGSPG